MCRLLRKLLDECMQQPRTERRGIVYPMETLDVPPLLDTVIE